MQNLHWRFVLCSNGQIYDGDFVKFCGFLRIYELYKSRLFFGVFLSLCQHWWCSVIKMGNLRLNLPMWAKSIIQIRHTHNYLIKSFEVNFWGEPYLIIASIKNSKLHLYLLEITKFFICISFLTQKQKILFQSK